MRRAVLAVSLLVMPGLMAVSSRSWAEEVEVTRDEDPTMLTDDDAPSSELLAQVGEERRMEICNRTDNALRAAGARKVTLVPPRPEDRFISEGWHYIERGRCETFVALYLYVERVDGRRRYHVGSDKKKMCIDTGNDFRIHRAGEGSACREIEGGRMRDFSKVPSGSGTYTWTLRY